jgi:GT2 family glycosyltransferase
VVVDGYPDGTVAALKLLRPRCQFRVIEQENRGSAGARNTGYRRAEADLVLFLDDDMLCDPALVAAHVAAHKDGCRIVAFGALFLSADSPPSLAAECFNREIGAYHLEQKLAQGAPWNITNYVFSNSSLARQMIIDVGGFDESFRMREDLELGVRLRNSGAQARYIRNAIALQYYDKTAADLLADAEAFALADVMFARKHPEVQIKGHVNWLEREARWKRTIRRFVVGSPAFEVCFLAPLCSLGQRFLRIPALRNIGVRALQIRRRIHWLRVVKRLTVS